MRLVALLQWVPAAPCAVRAQDAQPHVVALARQPAPPLAHGRPREEHIEGVLVIPDGEQGPAAQIGAERHRLAPPGSEQAPESEAVRRAQQRPVETHSRQALRSGRARVADEMEGGEHGR